MFLYLQFRDYFLEENKNRMNFGGLIEKCIIGEIVNLTHSLPNEGSKIIDIGDTFFQNIKFIDIEYRHDFISEEHLINLYMYSSTHEEKKLNFRLTKEQYINFHSKTSAILCRTNHY
jgi:hypothetical protein